jgi:hypothetical protein
MSATNNFENKILSLYLENADAANVGDATGLRGSTTAGVVYVSLSTGTLTDTSDQSTTEATYTGYARVSVARSTAGWSVAAGVGDNDAAITFGACTAGSSTVTYFGLGFNATTAGSLDVWGALTASLAITAGITPSFAIGALDITLD